MIAPQNKFGFISNCIFCQDQHLEMIANSLGLIIIAISVIAFFAGFVIRNNNSASPLLVMAAISLLFFAHYKETWTNGANWAIHATRSHHHPDKPPLTDYRRRKIIDGHQQFQRDVALKGWVFFAFIPFGIGFTAGAVRRRLRGPSA